MPEETFEENAEYWHKHDEEQYAKLQHQENMAEYDCLVIGKSIVEAMVDRIIYERFPKHENKKKLKSRLLERAIKGIEEAIKTNDA